MKFNQGVRWTFFCILLGAFKLTLHAQENVFLHPDKFYKKYFPRLKIKHDPPDTTYIKSYPYFLSAGVHGILPGIRYNIRSDHAAPHSSVLDFRTNIPDIIGFTMSYRKVSAGFAFLSKPSLQEHRGYAPTSYHTATINYNTSKYCLQFRYLKLAGLTDINTAYQQADIKRPDIAVKEFHFEGLYNFSWKKYSYLAPLTFSQRQVKTRGGVLLKAAVDYGRLAGDSNLIDSQKRLYYGGGLQTIQGLTSFSIRLAPGVGGTLVFFKKLYLSMALFTSFNLYFYQYQMTDHATTSRRQHAAWGLEEKTSLGYQTERFYAGIRYEANGYEANLKGMQLSALNRYAGLEVGYRFHAPRVVRKVYKKTMPPGM